RRVDHEVDEQRECRGREAAAGSELPLPVTTGSRKKPKRRSDDDHERDAGLLDVTEQRPEPVMVQRGRIDAVIEPPIHAGQGTYGVAGCEASVNSRNSLVM